MELPKWNFSVPLRLVTPRVSTLRHGLELDPKSVAYDTDGYQVAVVNLPTDGNFRIKIESSDEAMFYTTTNGRTKNNVSQLMMYHWCLRPTKNNY